MQTIVKHKKLLMKFKGNIDTELITNNVLTFGN